MTNKIKEFLTQYDFLTRLRGCKLATISSAMPEPESKTITDTASLNFSNGTQVILESSYEDMDLLFCEEEDVLLDIRPEENYEVVSNTGPSTPICTILVDEIPSSIRLLFDEIRYADDEENVRFFPVGLYAETPERRIGIWREMLEAFFMSADYKTASLDAPYSLQEKWGGWDSGKKYVATRYSYDFITGELTIIDKLES